jgi:hypothetical protein
MDLNAMIARRIMNKKRKQEHLTPKETVHAWCHYCIHTKLDSEVRQCKGHLVYATGQPCPFFQHRTGKRPSMKAFRQFCLQCMGGSSLLVKECHMGNCPMHLYRFGKNPTIRGADRERMSSIRPQSNTFSTAKTDQKRFS